MVPIWLDVGAIFVILGVPREVWAPRSTEIAFCCLYVVFLWPSWLPRGSFGHPFGTKCLCFRSVFFSVDLWYAFRLVLGWIWDPFCINFGTVLARVFV